MRGGWLPIVIVATALSGCTQWPSEGRGGLAERSFDQHPRVQALGARYVSAVANGARTVAASDTVEAELLLTRVSREYAAGLDGNADSDAAVLQRVLDRIEMRVRAARVTSG
jgi:hypothetical protein